MADDKESTIIEEAILMNEILKTYKDKENYKELIEKKTDEIGVEFHSDEPISIEKISKLLIMAQINDD